MVLCCTRHFQDAACMSLQLGKVVKMGNIVVQIVATQPHRDKLNEPHPPRGENCSLLAHHHQRYPTMSTKWIVTLCSTRFIQWPIFEGFQECRIASQLDILCYNNVSKQQLHCLKSTKDRLEMSSLDHMKFLTCSKVNINAAAVTYRYCS